MTRDEILAKARTENDGSIDAVIDIARADERKRIADELREECRSRDSWLWYELDESALEKVAIHVEKGLPS